LVALHKRLSLPLPDVQDACAWMLLVRATDEMQAARHPLVFEAKAEALLVLVKHGWRDVFRESLDANGSFKSHEEAGRFQFCLSVPLVPEQSLVD